MVGDKTSKAFDSADLRHNHKFNDLQSTCHSPELESENETLRLEIANLKREIVNHSLLNSRSDDEKIKMLERENKQLKELIKCLKSENINLQKQSLENFSKTMDDIKAAELDNVKSAGDSSSIGSKISNKLEEKAVSGLVGIVDLPNKSFCSFIAS